MSDWSLPNWIGDIIETQTGFQGLVVDVEMIYPGHPDSPARFLHVYWNESSRSRMGLRGRESIGKVSPFSVKRVVSRGEK